jgi:hypothetical protein
MANAFSRVGTAVCQRRSSSQSTIRCAISGLRIIGL